MHATRARAAAAQPSIDCLLEEVAAPSGWNTSKPFLAKHTERRTGERQRQMTTRQGRRGGQEECCRLPCIDKVAGDTAAMRRREQLEEGENGEH